MSGDADALLARSVTQCGHLEEQLARTRRHRGELTGLLRGAIADGALRDDYRDLAQRTLDRLRAEGAPTGGDAAT